LYSAPREVERKIGIAYRRRLRIHDLNGNIKSTTGVITSAESIAFSNARGKAHSLGGLNVSRRDNAAD